MIEAYRNFDFYRSWQYVDASESVIDITGAKCSFIIYKSGDLSKVLFACDNTTLLTITGADGLVELHIPGQVFNLNCGDYEFICRLILNQSTTKQLVLLEHDYIRIRHIPGGF